MASSSKCLSEFLSSIGPKQGDEGHGEAEEEPDWLLSSDEENQVRYYGFVHDAMREKRLQ